MAKSIGRAAWSVALLCCLARPALPEDAARPYTDGPLTKRDFAAKVPDPPPTSNGASLRAWTSGGINHRYQYRFVVEGKRYRLTLTEIDVFAVITRDKSWNAAPEDAELLDHEQGHADLAAIRAAQVGAQLRGMIRRRELTATAADEATGRKQLEDRLKKILDDESASLAEDNRRYDRETRHGADREQQTRHRAHHARMLRELKVTSEEKTKE